MVSDSRKISVHNVPNILSSEQMHDKLLIHFLRPRHGGGEVLELHYPTEKQGVAFITFELEEVAEAVLARKHMLELDNQKFHLEVRRAADSRLKTLEDYMTVETTLDLQLFPDKNAVKALVEKYGLRFYPETYAKLQIKGVFPALKKLREELLVILCNTCQSSSSLPSPSYVPCAEKKQHLLPSELGVHPRTRREVCSPRKQEDCSSGMDNAKSGTDHGNSDLYGTRVSYTNIHGGLVHDTPSQYRPHSGDKHRPMIPGKEFSKDPATRNSEGDQKTGNRSAELHSMSSLEQSMSSLDIGHSLSRHNLRCIAKVSNITVDLDTLKYVQIFKKHELDQILHSASVQMSVEEQGDLGHVALTSNSPLVTSVDMERVSGEVSKFLSTVEQNLRTQDIPFSGVTREKKVKMTEMSIKLADRYLTVTVSCKDRLHLIGPSQEVFLLKQTLMDHFPPEKDTVHPDTPNKRLSGGRSRRDGSCPASREKRSVQNISGTVDDLHSSGWVRSAGKAQETAVLNTHQSSSNRVANDRIKRASSLERIKSDEVRKVAIVPSDAGQNTDQSNSKLSERGREKNRSIKRTLISITNFRPRK